MVLKGLSTDQFSKIKITNKSLFTGCQIKRKTVNQQIPLILIYAFARPNPAFIL